MLHPTRALSCARLLLGTRQPRPTPLAVRSGPPLGPRSLQLQGLDLAGHPLSLLSPRNSGSPRRHYVTDESVEVQSKIPHTVVSSLIPEEAHMLHANRGPYGFFPMQLGQYLSNGAYQIVRKLGYGTYSSVWLAKQFNSKTNDGYNYVAIKILTTNAVRGEWLHYLHDVEMAHRLRLLSLSAKEHPGYKYCARPLHVFEQESAHGKHSCIVYPPYGPDAFNLAMHMPELHLPLAAAKRVTRQVLMALDFLHTTLGIVHGDVGWKNVLTQLPVSTDVIDLYLSTYPAETYEPMHIPELSSEPFVTVVSQPLPPLGFDPSVSDLEVCLSDLEVCLSDYGLAMRAEDITPKTMIICNHIMRAPEQLLGGRWGQPADIWAVGCLATALLTSETPFDLASCEKGCLGYMYDLLGPFPRSFLKRCRKADKYFDEKGARCFPWYGDDCITLDQWLPPRMEPETSSSEIAATLRFVRRCLTIDPTERPTAAELLADSWLAT
ncbi:kinase-like domain-containing protein [Trametes polyzona]|nr:kinase-like domain-containing protein [Trametes polyzona]